MIKVRELAQRVRNAQTSALIEARDWFHAATSRTDAGKKFESLRVGSEKLLAAAASVERQIVVAHEAAAKSGTVVDAALIAKLTALVTTRRAEAAQAIDLKPAM